MSKKNQLNIIIIILINLVVFCNIFLPGYTNGFSLEWNIDFYELYNNSISDQILYDRIIDPVFKKRVVMTTLQIKLNTIFGLPYQLSFNLINLFCLLWAIVILYITSNKYYKNSKIDSLISVIYFLISMPIVFAFSGYTSSYDDFLQYAVIFQLFFFYHNKKYFFVGIFFFLSLIIREHSLIFALPILFWPENGLAIINRFFLVVLPIIGFVFFQFYLGIDSDSINFLVGQRFTGWEFNFANPNRLFEVIFCIGIVLGAPIYIIKKGFHYSKHLYCLGFLLSINTLLVCTTALVHETRLLFLPLLLYYPLIGNIVEHKINLPKIFNLKSLLILICVCILVLFLYHPSAGKSSLVYKIYAVLNLWLLFNIPDFITIKRIDS